jgi:hypothetical protein
MKKGSQIKNKLQIKKYIAGNYGGTGESTVLANEKETNTNYSN